jgi:hypothetical protein
MLRQVGVPGHRAMSLQDRSSRERRGTSARDASADLGRLRPCLPSQRLGDTLLLRLGRMVMAAGACASCSRGVRTDFACEEDTDARVRLTMNRLLLLACWHGQQPCRVPQDLR